MSPLSIGTKILGGGAALLLTFLFIGLVLPGDWDASASRVIHGTPETIRTFLDSPEGWQKWTPWPATGVTHSGPERGTGARLAWDDPDLGAGSFTIDRVDSRQVQYSVEIGDGSMRTRGTVTLTPQGDGVRVDWQERGDLGRNPLMGWWALSMGRAQGRELAKGLERLEGLVTGASAPAPDRPTVDSVPDR